MRLWTSREIKWLIYGVLTCWLLCLPATGRAEESPLALLHRHAIAFAESQVAEGSLTLQVLPGGFLPRLKGGALRVQASHLSKPQPFGPFFVVCKVFENEKLVGSARINLLGQWKGTVLKMRCAQPRKALLTPEAWDKVAFEGTPPPHSLRSVPPNSRLKLARPAGHVLTETDLEAVPLIQAGDTVQCTLQCESLSLTHATLAKSAGALGEQVKLLFPGGKHMQATVTGPGEACVIWRP